MPRYYKTFLLLPMVLLLSVFNMGVCSRAEGRSGESVGSEYQSITPVAASRLIAEKKNLTIVDVRTLEERELAAIENSVLIPVGQVIKGDFSLPKTQPILIYCAVGGRSFYAAKYLIIRGYQEIYNLEGGVEAWQKAGLPVIKKEK
jgi:rhodanese-related sulfurtransferase